MTALLFLRQTFAEWRPVWAQLRRTRLAFSLTLIVLAGAGTGGRVLLPTLAFVVLLAATATAAASLTGPEAGRVAALTLRHPASPLALAVGRWIAVATLAGLVTLLAGVGAAWQVELGWRAGVDAALSAMTTALPGALCGPLVTVGWWRLKAP